MKQRFRNIMDASGKKRGTALFCAVALIIALVGCAVNAETESPAAPTEETARPQDYAELTREKTPDATVTNDTPEHFSYTGREKETVFYTERDSMVPEDVEKSNAEGYDTLVGTDYPAEDAPLDGYSEVDATEPQTESGELPYATRQEDVQAIYESTQWSKDPYSGGKMAWPLPGNTEIIEPVGITPQIPDNIHTGVDIAAAFGATIIAANDGTVMKVSRDMNPAYGMYVIIDHGGRTSTLYAQCSKILVEEGEQVVKGEKIAEVGSTGHATQSSLHFEVREGNAWVNPMPYITSTGFIWPTIDGGYISETVGTYPGHTGMDIAGLPSGTPVYAAAAGTVTKAVDSNVGYGRHIQIDHGNGFVTLYAHNSELYVNVGDIVAQGQTIAAIGRTGNITGHRLHFEVRFNGRILRPEDFVEMPVKSE